MRLFHHLSARWLLVLAFAGSLFSTGPVYAKHFEILTAGDSVTQGKPEINSPQYGARVGGYEPRLETLISSNSNGKHDAAVWNYGVQGDYSGGPNSQYPWTIGGVNQIDSTLNSRPGDIILIMYGANDAFSQGGISPQTVADNIGIMVDKSRAKGVVPVVSNITPNTTSPYGSMINAWITGSYNPQIQAKAAEKKVPMADNYAALAAGWPYPNAYTDGLHLSSTGYLRMAEEWYRTLDPLLNPFSIVPVLQLLLLDE